MFLELRNYQLRPGTVVEAERRFKESLQYRTVFSTMAGLWHPISGQMDRIIHIWPYQSLDERMQVRQAARDTGKWPPFLEDILVTLDTRIIVLAPDSPPIEPRRLGRCYEICFDNYLPGGPARVAPLWGNFLAVQTRPPSLVACGCTELGPLNQWIHIWGFESADTRQVDRCRMGQLPVFGERLISQESWLLEPAECSLLR